MHLQFFLLATQSSHDHIQLLLGFSQLSLFGLNYFGYPVIGLHGTHPAAQPICCLAYLVHCNTVLCVYVVTKKESHIDIA